MKQRCSKYEKYIYIVVEAFRNMEKNKPVRRRWNGEYYKNKPYSADDIRFIIKLTNEDINARAIALRLGRSVKSISNTKSRIRSGGFNRICPEASGMIKKADPIHIKRAKNFETFRNLIQNKESITNSYNPISYNDLSETKKDEFLNYCESIDRFPTQIRLERWNAEQEKSIQKYPLLNEFEKFLKWKKLKENI
jgi:hypothetical protein